MKRALLISFEPAHFIELQRVAQLLARSGGWTPVFYFAKTYPDTPARIEACKAQGWEWRAEGLSIAADGAVTPPSTPSASSGPIGWRAPVQSVLGHFPEPAKRGMRRLRAWLRRYPERTALLRAAAARASEALRESRPDLLVLPEENIEHLTSVFVRRAKELDLPTVIIPFTVATALEPAESYFGNPAHTLGVLGSLFRMVYPRWVITHRGQRLVRLPAMDAIATERMGYAPPQPWILNSGDAEAIAVESEAMLAHYRACGFPETQLEVTGALYDDELAAAASGAEVRTRLGLDERRVSLRGAPRPGSRANDRAVRFPEPRGPRARVRPRRSAPRRRMLALFDRLAKPR